ncbi:MAG: GNAT family N-acetyltransferase [Prochloraceae cyanobacterium]
MTIKPQIRLAKKSDKDTVLGFCKNTWKDQKDFVLNFWDEWIEESENKLFVATLEEVPVALIKIDFLSNSETWWKALRVDPNYRSLGISKILDRFVSEHLATNKIKTSRTCVYSNNKIMLDNMSKRNREKLAYYFHYQAPSIDSQQLKLVQFNFNNLDLIIDQIFTLNTLDSNLRYYTKLITKFQALTEQLIEKSLREQKIWGLIKDSKLLAIAIQSDTDVAVNKLFYIGYIDAIDSENLKILLNELRKLSYIKGYELVRSIFPDNETFKDNLTFNEYYKPNQTGFWLYEWLNDDGHNFWQQQVISQNNMLKS